MVMDFKIDFVVSWVNGQDPKWLEKYVEYKDDDTLDVKNARFRDYGIFKYWFRAVEQNAPWVNHIYLVTDDQKPSWLEAENPKITVIDHSEIINDKYRPVFNSNAIELNLYKIKNLEEHFVYFNDDMFLNRPVKPTDFFSKKGLPKDTAGLNAIQPLYDFD
ncbi:sugar phosphotransferase, partial [Pediococcus acidilactici]